MTLQSTDSERAGVKIALLWRGDPRADAGPPSPSNRLYPLFEALASLGVTAEPVVYADDAASDVRARLLDYDGVLVWVDPISPAGDRRTLDPVLRSVAEQGVWVSAHPDVILKMGTKDVIFRTRELGWGTDTQRHDSVAQLGERLAAELAAGETRVLKQHRGNGGNGVWKVAPLSAGMVEVQHALRGSVPERMALPAFVERCARYFDAGGCMIDQLYQARLPDGMIRCYVVRDRVAGFGHQLIKALLPPPPEGPSSEAAQPGPRIMHAADAAQFQALRARMDGEWIPGLQRLAGVASAELPAIWDADFLYGPRTASGEDSYVLCEINVSAVLPFPPHALAPLACAARDAALAARRARRERG